MPRIFDNRDQHLLGPQYYSAFSDYEHINDSLVRKIKTPTTCEDEEWIKYVKRLSQSMEKNAVRKVINTKEGHKIEYNEMDASESKPIIDDIDRVLAKHYGFTTEELDFIPSTALRTGFTMTSSIAWGGMRGKMRHNT